MAEERIPISSPRYWELVGRAYALFCDVFPLKPCQSAQEYEFLTAHVNAMVDQGASETTHPLFGLYEVGLGLMALWEGEVVHELPLVDPRQLLEYLMKEHGLKQVDLTDCVARSTLSAYLNGRRGLSRECARRLATRFGLNADTFL